MSGNSLFTKIPIFTLFKLDPTEAIRLYNEGAFADFKIPRPEVEDGGLEGTGVVFNPSYGTDVAAPIFTFRDRSGIDTVIVSSNCYYDMPEEKSGRRGKSCSKPTKWRCHWCRLAFSAEDVKPIGAVVSKEHTFDEETGAVRYQFWTDGLYDDFGCTLADILDKGVTYERAYPRVMSDTLGLFALMHPKTKMPQPAKDWRLLKVNGGSLEPAAWKDESHRYIPIPILDVRPMRTLHQKRCTKL